MLATGLADAGSRSERLVLERAVLRALDDLRAASGGYLQALRPYAGEYGGEIGATLEALGGRAPAILVWTGDADYQSKAMNNRVGIAVIDLHVDAISASLRSREARVAGDEASASGQDDPGIYGILADARDRLMGAELGVPGIAAPVAVGEESLLLSAGLSVFRMTFRVRCSVVAAAPVRSPVHQVESIEHRHRLEGAGLENPIVTAVAEESSDA